MNNVNPSALFRTLIVYAVCVPLAIIIGYLLSNPLDYESLGFMGVVIIALALPLLIKWHYPVLVFSWSIPATLVFFPGHPSFFLMMVAVSLTISTVERILDRSQQGLPVPCVRWPLLVFLAVIVFTAKMTGGFGLHSMGSGVYGGKKYIILVAGILSYFAITARPIPKKHANLYLALYFLPGIFAVLEDVYSFVPSPLRFIYYVFPAASFSLGANAETVVLGHTRLSGTAGAAGVIFYCLLAWNGFRDNVLTPKLWRPLLLGLAFMGVFLGGYRSMVLGAAMTLALVFFFEKLHRTGVMLVVAMAGILGGALLVPLAPHLPYTFQRSLAFLPLDISTEARTDAEGSTDWRVDMWEALMPQVPTYLWLGKGYAFSAETFNESMTKDSPFAKSVDAAQNPLALAGDFHSGPLSVVLALGIWGVVAWLWFWAAGFFVVWRNYHYGDPDLRHVNVFLYAFFICKCITFLFIAGAMADDMCAFAGVVGLSVAMNHGVRRRPPAGAGRQATPAALRRPVREQEREPMSSPAGMPAMGK